MYEDITFEIIMERLLERIPSDFDKREGSIIYDALAPAAIELQNLYIELDVILNETFADTASLPYLIRRAAERGITQKKATKAVLKAVSTPVDLEIELGSRFSLDTLNYVITEKITNGEYKVECETVGVEGNNRFGNIIPIDYIQGLQTIEITELLIPAEDDEDVESLRKKYFQSTTSQAYGGNIADYKEKVMQISGVGGVKVTPTWNGGGTVKVTVIDSTLNVPSEEQIKVIQNAVDPVGHQGEGYGVAPIGHVVTVEGAEGVSVNITTEITYATDWSWDASATSIKNAVDTYLTELCKVWDEDNEGTLIVRISQLESAILKCDGVIDISGTLLNGYASNLQLTKYQIPVRGLINGN
jgi:uncharacterized phage protein gp47/JayE